MKNKTYNFIEYLRKYPNADNIRVFENHLDWEYYFAITGFINNYYFSVFISKYDESTGHETEIVKSVTECKGTIKNLLKKFDLL